LAAVFEDTLTNKMLFKKYSELKKIRPPLAVIYEHLRAEYFIMRPAITDADAIDRIDGFEKLFDETKLSWDDIYYFELILAKYAPVESLKSRIQKLRFDLRSITSPQAYNEYLASKPADLQSPPEPTDPPKGDQQHFESLLREDLRDLLDRLYVEYATLPVREERLNYLSWFAANLCLAFMICVSITLLILFFAPTIYELTSTKSSFKEALSELGKSDRLSSLTIFVVGLNGALGGFVSALQRIQKPSKDGNSIYNLSTLFYGSYSVFIAPITGAIFATLLYLMFTAGILSGAFFPVIYTPEGKGPEVVVQQKNEMEQATDVSVPASIAPQNFTQGLNSIDFLAKSGPVNGKNFALLLVWCFIAGFAESFVPDALDRIISKSRANE
jgi:hypothetical protein